MTPVKALVLTGFGLNCDYETDYALKLAGARLPPNPHQRTHLRRSMGV